MVPNPRRLVSTAAALFTITLALPHQAAAQKTAVKCKDGTTSATTGRGACSGHGGVDKTATASTKKAVKTELKTAKSVAKTTPNAQVTVNCADGTTSNSTGRGACSGHGGVKAAKATSVTTGAPVAPPKTVAKKTAPIVAPPARVTTTNSTVAGTGGGEDKNPAGAIAQCKDGFYSHAKNRTGACSRHGGVAKWM